MRHMSTIINFSRPSTVMVNRHGNYKHSMSAYLRPDLGLKLTPIRTILLEAQPTTQILLLMISNGSIVHQSKLLSLTNLLIVTLTPIFASTKMISMRRSCGYVKRISRIQRPDRPTITPLGMDITRI